MMANHHKALGRLDLREILNIPSGYACGFAQSQSNQAFGRFIHPQPPYPGLTGEITAGRAHQHVADESSTEGAGLSLVALGGMRRFGNDRLSVTLIDEDCRVYFRPLFFNGRLDI